MFALFSGRVSRPWIGLLQARVPELSGLLVPLNKQALSLSPTPSAVAEARRWVVGVCSELGRTDLVDCAELGVSELVTNAILHGQSPIGVRVRGTTHHPRIEVYDASNRPPVIPLGPVHTDAETDHEDALLTGGRGLALVAMSSTAWGASIEPTGKVVWFEPAETACEDWSRGVIEGDEDAESGWAPLPDSMTVVMANVDVQLFASALTQYNNLRRELRLLALSHENEYPLARDLSQMFSTFEHQLPPSSIHSLAAILRSAGPSVDLVFSASPRSTQVFCTMLDVFELADSFCTSQQLLSLARTPEQVELQQWLLDEFLNQADGKEPSPWHGGTESTPSRSAPGIRLL